MNDRDIILRNIEVAIPGSSGSYPSLRIELFSEDNRDLATFAKWSEHRCTPSVDHILLVVAVEPLAMLWWRDNAGEWQEKTIRGLDEAVEMPKLGIALPMRGIYQDVILPPLATAFDIMTAELAELNGKRDDGPASAQVRALGIIIDRIGETLDEISRKIDVMIADSDASHALMKKKKEQHLKRMQEP